MSSPSSSICFKHKLLKELASALSHDGEDEGELRLKINIKNDFHKLLQLEAKIFLNQTKNSKWISK